MTADQQTWPSLTAMKWLPHIILLLALVLNCHICESSSTSIQWVWMGGSITPVGIYNQPGVPSSSNVPGGRNSPAIWYDSSSQELWLFGGYGYESLHSKQSGAIEGMRLFC